METVPAETDGGLHEVDLSIKTVHESEAKTFSVPETSGGAEKSSVKAETLPGSDVSQVDDMPHNKISFGLPTIPLYILLLGLGGIVWAAGAVLYMIRGIILYNIYINTIKKCAIPAPEDIKSTYTLMCRRFGVKRVPELYIYADASSPMVCGFFKSMMVLPDISFTQNDLVGVFAHELTHLRRRDTWMKLVGMFAKGVNWYNPLAYAAVREQQRYMELSCDELALSGLSDAARFAYGGVVLDIIKKCRENRTELTIGFSQKKSLAVERLREITGKSRKKRGSWTIVVTLALVVLCGNIMLCRLTNDVEDNAVHVPTETENAVSGEAVPVDEALTEQIRLDCGEYDLVLPDKFESSDLL